MMFIWGDTPLRDIYVCTNVMENFAMIWGKWLDLIKIDTEKRQIRNVI